MLKVLSDFQLDVDKLKSNYISIDYFGLGFIQLKLDKNTRVHFYTKNLLPIISEEEIHNHRYDFTSYIYRGVLQQDIYNIKYDTNGNFIEEQESCKKDCKINSIQTSCDVELGSTHVYSEGSYYFVSHNVFHKIIFHKELSNNCITIINRSDYKKEFAEVIRSKNSEKICPFSKTVEEKELWQIVRECCN